MRRVSPRRCFIVLSGPCTAPITHVKCAIPLVSQLNQYVSTLVFRKYEDLYQRLSILEAGNIFQETRCLKPCTYRDYRFLYFCSWNPNLTISPKNRFIGGSETTSFGAKDFTFSLWAVSNDTTIEREVRLNVDNDDGDGDGSPKCWHLKHKILKWVTVFNDTATMELEWILLQRIVLPLLISKVLIYPLVSLIADIGGTLGLFLGFSFMTIWDGVEVFGLT